VHISIWYGKEAKCTENFGEKNLRDRDNLVDTDADE
jgi:hypothetical protein